MEVQMPKSVRSVQVPLLRGPSLSRRAILAGAAASMMLPAVTASTDAPATLRKEKTMGSILSPTLLAPETSVVLLLDYQAHVMEGIRSTDHELIELNARALAPQRCSRSLSS
jgi:hypothetical protein